MPVLALDTSGSIAVALLADDGTVLAADAIESRRRHAEVLSPMIRDVLDRGGSQPAALTAVAVGTGPAPFTGLRVGLVTARTLGLALDIPVWGVCSLDAVAAQAAIDLGLVAGTEVFVAADALRREVYWARYRMSWAGSPAARSSATAAEGGGPDAMPATVDPVLLAGPGVGAAADVAAEAVGAVIVGEGAAAYPEVLAATGWTAVNGIAATLGRLAVGRQALGVAQPTDPLYLRRPDVQQPAPRKRATEPPTTVNRAPRPAIPGGSHD